MQTRITVEPAMEIRLTPHRVALQDPRVDTFSRRMGLQPAPTPQYEDLSPRLRTRLHNRLISDVRLTQDADILGNVQAPTKLAGRIVDAFFGLSTAHLGATQAPIAIAQLFMSGSWNRVFDLLEFVVKEFATTATATKRFTDGVNAVLAEEHAAYRFVGALILPITDKAELDGLTTALDSARPYHTARAHLENAVRLLADRTSANYANTVKEAISAVEAMARIVAGDESATLGAALNHIAKEAARPFHPALLAAFSKLYGWTSDEGGIRHANKAENTEPDQALASFMVVTCAAMVNYMIRLHTRV